MKTMIVMAAMVAGCVGGQQGPAQEDGGPAATNVRFLCVGMETSRRFGDCPGCERDVSRLSALMRDKFSYEGDVLVSAQATKSAVVEKFKSGIENTPEDGLFLFFYSGHGGQECLYGEEPGDSDKMDEFLCLYDTYMMDDEIWDIVSKCRGRVFLYFDACHSATMYRSVQAELKLTEAEKGDAKKARALAVPNEIIEKTRGFTFRPEKLVKASAAAVDGGARQASVRLLCWSGCKEEEYSYGGSSGGTLTSAVVYHWKKGISYDSLWESVRSWVVRVQPGQNPVQTYVGYGFYGNVEAFK